MRQVTSLQVTKEQLNVLKRHPRHKGVLAELGISLPYGAIVMVNDSGIQVLVAKSKHL